MAPRRPKHNDGELISPKMNYYGSLADYKESMTASKESNSQGNRYVTSDMLSRNSVVNNTTFQSTQTGDYYDKSGRPGGARFIKDVPVFPQPQSIQRMPVQLAGYTDYARKDEELYKMYPKEQNVGGRRVNTAGNPAVGLRIDDIESAQDFYNTKSVFVNPLFKDPYDKIGNDPDSSDRSRGPQIVDEWKLATLRAMSKGTTEWAKANSKYFDKPFVVGKSPVASGTKDAPLTTRVNIYGESGGYDFAGYVQGGGSWTPGIKKDRKVLKAPGGENRVTPAKALRKVMTLNTDLDPSTTYDSRKWAGVIQHEFGHTMGMGHPHNRKDGTTLNSELSYDAERLGPTILPATINAYKKVMDMNLGYTGAEEINKKQQKQAEYFDRLRELNYKRDRRLR
jgi:hypothetical protein